VENNFYQLIYILTVLFLPLLLGYIIKRRYAFFEPRKASKIIIIFITKAITPFIVMFSFWALDLSNASIFTLPLLGVVITTLALVPAGFFAKLHNFSHRQTGSYLAAAMFSNIGYTLGGFIAFVLYGEIGFGLTVLFCLYFKPYYYTIGFYIAENYSSRENVRVRDNFKKIFTEGIRLFPLLGLGLGVALNLFGINRPDYFGTLNSVLIPVTTFFYMLAIGFTMNFKAVRRFKLPVLSMSFIKFIWTPVIGILFAYLLNYHNVMGGLPFKIVVIESFMPTAIASLVLPVLFDLDQDLANSCWIFTTLFLIALLPVILFILSIL
jgi:hypothetical protein